MNEFNSNLADDLAVTERPAARAEPDFRAALDALPAAVYITDSEGEITYFNRVAAALWGGRPRSGAQRWSGFRKLFWPDGRPLRPDEAPIALALRENRSVRGLTVVAERSGGIRATFASNPSPIHTESGELVGAVDMLVDVGERNLADDHARWLAALVECSQDAIISKDLNGVVLSWNAAAERIFGYSAREMLGRSVSVLLPPGCENEEPAILERIRRGERVEHYETVRQRKDGGRVDISLTVSPLRNAAGAIVGASKIARDISERRFAREQQQLLLKEMNHRIKNLFTLASSVVTLSARSARTPTELAASVGDRLEALARAHALTLAGPCAPTRNEPPATLQALIRTIVAPYENRGAQAGERVSVSGADLALSHASLTSLALILHEVATNAAKYGALSTPDGRVAIGCQTVNNQLVLHWDESGGPALRETVNADGFGGALIRAALEGQLGGAIAREWRPEGLSIRLTLAVDRLTK